MEQDKKKEEKRAFVHFILNRWHFTVILRCLKDKLLERFFFSSLSSDDETKTLVTHFRKGIG